MAPLLVITPTLECESFFTSAMRSVAETLDGRIDYIHLIIGPGSLAGEIGRYPRLVFMAESPGTKGVFDAVDQAIRAGIDRWNPAWITYINHDDLLLPGFATIAQSAPGSDTELHYGKVWWINEEGRRIFRMPVWPYRRGLAELFADGVSPLTQQGLIFSSAAYLRAGGFDRSLRYMADSDLWFRLLYAGAKARFYAADVAAFRIRAGQLSANFAEADREKRTVQNHYSRRFPIPAIRRRGWRLLFKLNFIPTYCLRIVRGKGLRTRASFSRLSAPESRP